MSSESGQQQSDLLISGYLDDQLDVQQLQQLQQLMLQSPQLADRFAQQHLLHDRLRNLGMLAFAVPAESPSARAVSVVPGSKRLLFSRRQLRRFLTAVCVLLIGVSAGFIFWSGLAGTPAAAASAELQRLLQASTRQVDRTWQLAVEETVASDLRRRRTLPGRAAQRPPKVSLDGALLCVRSGGQFVLTRTLPDGTQFLTGSDGLCSWAVRPDQSVRVSRNPAHFSRDIPGHEHSMSFVQIDQLLAQLKSNYYIQVLPGVTAAGDAEESLEHSDQLMIAVRRRKVPGPGRVEIRYDALTGDIHQLRFIDMPYGPDRLTLRMTLVSEESLQPSFFSHDSHHPPEWRVEQE
ncbi:MAG: hypothetical protein ACK6D0_09290 [Planctomyces sp.]